MENIYVLNNIDLLTFTFIKALSCDPWLWSTKLGHASMHGLDKLFRLELVVVLPKLKFEKGHILMHVGLVSRHALHSKSRI